MTEIFAAPFAAGLNVNPWHMLARLLAALLCGAMVAWIYVRTTQDRESGSSFPVTLALLAVLIAMVTQVIGDNVARAFSLVGALSIVRFRTVVRDTKDTAFVIFAVVIGMAVGAQNPWVAGIGLVVVGAAAFAMSRGNGNLAAVAEVPHLLTLRIGLGHDIDKLAGPALSAHLKSRRLMSVATSKQGAALEFIYETTLLPNGSAEDLVKTLNRIDGLYEVRLERRDFQRD
jgi:hypothetical protein